MADISPENLLAALEAIAVAPPTDIDTDLRVKLYEASKKASLALEQPTETVIRLLLSHPVERTLVKIALDLELFSKIAKADTAPHSLASLVESTGADSLLLKRIMSSLAAFGAVKQVSSESYTLAPSYLSLAKPDFGRAVLNCSEFLDATYQALPGLLRSNNYQNPTDPKNTAVQRAFDRPDTDLIGILMQNPKAGQGFGMLMSSWGEGHAMLQHLYPVTEKLVDTFEENISPVMFVDVGGGYGQRAMALKKDFPQIPGKIIVQDLPSSIDRAPPAEGLEFQVHDFFTEQPIKEAKSYYIRQCLHNWPDDECVKVLRHLGDAMKPEYSVLLIHEQIMPEKGAGQWVSIQDVNMMALCGVAERSEQTWRDLIEKAGLMVTKVYLSRDGVSESVIEAAKVLSR
ncbi:unnamed protein product [Periconia digitata]|uniref:O-methyltransferase C-terminal domain-containing protein n=1 Tax=Periconia digitata TaxID=1303443 RepID=A0A9W4U985_9PLEO|nr:unnamed protein product [Periconia digitata]